MAVNYQNDELSQGHIPPSFETAVVKPQMKKSSLPKDTFKGYQPVSGLCFTGIDKRIYLSNL